MPRDDDRPARRARPVPDDDGRDDLPAQRRGGVPVWAWVGGAVAVAVVAVCGVGGLAVVLTQRISTTATPTAVVPAGPAVDMTNRPLKTVMSLSPAGPVLVRGRTQLSDFYVGEFDKGTYLAVKLVDPNDAGAILDCYVRRNSEDANKLTQRLGDGQPAIATFQCRLSVKSNGLAHLDRVVSLD